MFSFKIISVSMYFPKMNLHINEVEIIQNKNVLLIFFFKFNIFSVIKIHKYLLASIYTHIYRVVRKILPGYMIPQAS